MGSVIVVQANWKSDGVMWFSGGTSFGTRSHVDTYKYSLAKDDGPKLQEFLDKIEKLIPEELIRPGMSEVDHLVIAVQRYEDSLLKPEITESRLSFAIMALEALFLKEEEREELEHRLGQRVAKLLAEFGHEPLEVYNKLKRSYSIRSSFVHGSPISKDQQSEALKLTQDILEYVRLSIVIQLQLKGTIDKDKFLSLLDNTLLTQNASEKLQKILEENCEIR